MTEPLPTDPPTGPPIAKRLKQRLPVVPHRPLDEQATAPFAAWLDVELAKFEDRFHYMATPRSIMTSIRR